MIDDLQHLLPAIQNEMVTLVMKIDIPLVKQIPFTFSHLLLSIIFFGLFFGHP